MKKIFSLTAGLFLSLCGCTAEKITLPANAVLIDVRTPAEFASGSIDGALSIPLDTVESQIAAAVPQKDTPVYLFCRSGRRSGIAAAKLQKAGYTAVINLGGIKEAAKKLQK